MRFNIIVTFLLILHGGLCKVAFAENNGLTIYVSQDLTKCISFNLVKLNDPIRVENTRICPGIDGGFNQLEDGKYQLFGTEVDSLSINPFGDNEYINNPITLSNVSNLAIYYPSRFTKVNAKSNMTIKFPTEFKLADSKG